MLTPRRGKQQGTGGLAREGGQLVLVPKTQGSKYVKEGGASANEVRYQEGETPAGETPAGETHPDCLSRSPPLLTVLD